MKTINATISKIKATGKAKGYRITDKQAIFIQEKLKGKPGRQAALIAYNTTPETAHSISTENLQKPAVINTFHALMDTIGLTDEYLVDKVKQGIENTNPEGKQSTFIEMALKMKGKLTQVNVNLSHTIKENRKTYDL